MAVLERATLISWLAAASATFLSCGDGDLRPDASCADCAQDAGAAQDEDAASEPLEDASLDAGVDAGDGMQAVTIRFKAKLGDEPLICGRSYERQGKSHVKATPQDFRFYVQEVRLVHKGTAQEERLIFDSKAPFQRPEVAMIDFTDAAGQCNGNGGSIVNTTITGKLPAGDYDGIVFVNGVPEELNHAGPAETAGAPLDDVTLFWSWLGGYRFVVAELLPEELPLDAGHAGAVADAGSGDGGGDASSDGGGGHGGGVGAAFVHIGSTGCGGTPAAGFTCSRKARNEIRLDNFDPAHDFVIADLSAVFKDSDLATPPQCHGIDAPCAAPYAAFGIDMSTGNAMATQQVFRVE